jgi:hypothetical protein
VAIFYGIQIIWERDAGVLAKLMVTPTPRSALITGKAFAAGLRSLVQAVVIVVLSAILGVALTGNPLRLLATACVVVLGSAFFGSRGGARLLPWPDADSSCRPARGGAAARAGAVSWRPPAPSPPGPSSPMVSLIPATPC